MKVVLYLVVHDGPQTHDANMDIVLLADQTRVLQSSTTWQRVGPSHQSRAVETKRSPELWIHFLETPVMGLAALYLMECRAERETDEEGDGRLQSPWRSSMERLQGESMEPTSLPASDSSPSNLIRRGGFLKLFPFQPSFKITTHLITSAGLCNQGNRVQLT